MPSYGSEFLPLLLVFLLTLVSPGADFILVIRQALVHGRRAAFVTILGIAAGLICHVSYTILGLGLIISQSVFLFNLIKWAGVAYLIFIGIKALISRGSFLPTASSPSEGQLPKQSLWHAFLLGVMVNLLNPKAVLFFLSIFSVLIAPTTPVLVQFSYCLVLILLAVIWFTLVNLFMTTPSVTALFSRLSQWVDRITGIVFILLGVRLMLQKIS